MQKLARKGGGAVLKAISSIGWLAKARLHALLHKKTKGHDKIEINGLVNRPLSYEKSG